jgi:hypothetical protein
MILSKISNNYYDFIKIFYTTLYNKFKHLTLSLLLFVMIYEFFYNNKTSSIIFLS